MRLLLDEMITAIVADQLRARDHDVIAVQDLGLAHLRGTDDGLLLDQAVDRQRAVVTDSIPDCLRCHHLRLDAGQKHYGLPLFSNDTFPRHRHDRFISHILAAIEEELDANPSDDDSNRIRWLTR